MNDETFSITFMVSLDLEALSLVEFDLRTNTNNQWNFLDFVVSLLYIFLFLFIFIDSINIYLIEMEKLSQDYFIVVIIVCPTMDKHRREKFTHDV